VLIILLSLVVAAVVFNVAVVAAQGVLEQAQVCLLLPELITPLLLEAVVMLVFQALKVVAKVMTQYLAPSLRQVVEVAQGWQQTAQQLLVVMVVQEAVE
jgi:hypothetical protein